MNEDQRIPTLPAATLCQFVAGRNIAKCEIGDDGDTAVITYGERQPTDIAYAPRINGDAVPVSADSSGGARVQ